MTLRAIPTWCPLPDSNRHARRLTILSRVRLPVTLYFYYTKMRVYVHMCKKLCNFRPFPT
jgi:hypothetical protein